MASPFRDDVVAMLAAVFASDGVGVGFDATYTPAGGGAAVSGIHAIPDTSDVETLADVFAGARTRTTKRLVALLKADVPARPEAGAVIAIDGLGTFTVAEEAMCLDRFQLIWICAVAE